MPFGKFGLNLQGTFDKLGLYSAVAWKSGIVDLDLILVTGKADLKVDLNSQLAALDMVAQEQDLLQGYKAVLQAELAAAGQETSDKAG